MQQLVASRHLSKRLFLALALLLIAALGLAACDSGDTTSGPTATPRPGTVLEPPKPLGDFTLTAHTGAPFELSDLQGTVSVVYFGFTNCPDVCPTTLASYKQVKTLLDEDAEQVQFVFIGVDPPRDTLTRLANYVTAFDPDFIGATGDDASLRSVANDFGVFFQRVDYDSDVNYLVDHTASTFIVGPDGALRVIVPYGTDPAVTADYIDEVLADA
jgi:protein SCO1/2